MEVQNRLKVLRKKAGITQQTLANALGLSKILISKYETGDREISRSSLTMFARYFGVSVDYVMGLTKGIPVLGTVRGGEPIFGEEYIEGYVPGDNPYNECFALRVTGRSMEPRIMEGDLVIVHQQQEIGNGEIAVVAMNDDEFTVKVVQHKDNGIMLVAFNMDVYVPHFYGADEIRDSRLRIVGKVVEVRHYF